MTHRKPYEPIWAFMQKLPSVLLDVIFIQLGVVLAFLVRGLWEFPLVAEAVHGYLQIAVWFTAMQIVWLYIFDLYHPSRSSSSGYLDLLVRVGKAVVAGALAFGFFAYLMNQFAMSRSLVFLLGFFNLLLLAGWRGWMLHFQKKPVHPVLRGLLLAVLPLFAMGILVFAGPLLYSYTKPRASADATVKLNLELVASGLYRPLYLTHAGDGSGRLFVVEQTGVIRVVKDGGLLPEPFLDIRERVELGDRPHTEQGLLGLAFHPDYADNGRFFINYTRRGDGDTVIAEYRVSEDPNVADPMSERVILLAEQPGKDHNGGQLEFGPEGYLYIGLGDGRSSGDPLGNGQKLDTLLGKVLRIDVDRGAPYAIPSDNPFMGRAGVRGEIWAYGLRNPWRFSFDRQTGRLFLGDVGQDHWEEINLVVKGGNYGWNVMEGRHCFQPPEGCDRRALLLPITELAHRPYGAYAIIAGYVYRGKRFAELRGRFFFGDWSMGRIWSLRETALHQWEREELIKTSFHISSFGEDEEGELYVVDYSQGALYRIALER
jgi:glucose/arabinose dehydrogenase